MSEKQKRQTKKPDGDFRIEDTVVSKLAGLATREVEGVYDVGGGASRALGGVLESVPGVDGQTRGISVEVGEKEAAVDVTLALHYGKPIPRIAGAVRKNVIEKVEKLSGLRVTEVNITVSDVVVLDGGGRENR